MENMSTLSNQKPEVFNLNDCVVSGLCAAFLVLVILWLVNYYYTNYMNATPATKEGMMSDPGADNPDNISGYGTAVLNEQGDMRYTNLKNMTKYDDYNSLIQYMALEPEIFKSQDLYTTDMNRSTSGASMLGERDDPNDVVPWLGLRKPKYQEAYVMPGARQETSENPDQMRPPTYYVVG